MTREEAINVINGWVLADKDREALETILPEIKENEDKKTRKQIIYAINQLHVCDETKDKCIAWVNKQIPPKWLYRLEYKDGTCGLWYNGDGKWCFEQGIGSVEGCKTKYLPMDHDERYKQDGRDWFSSCSRKEDLLHWYSLKDAEELLKRGFVFTRYLATEYHEYENETVFIKETSLVREEIDIFELFGKTKPMFKEGDWVVNERNGGTVHQIKSVVSNVSNNKNAYDLTDGDYISTSSVGNYHLWTLQDANPGDILKYYSSIFILKKKHDNFVETYCTLNEDDSFFIIDNEFNIDKGIIKPASREQRDCLFARIKESGYEWDETAKKLVNSTLKEKEEIDTGFTKMIKKREDKRMIETIISDLQELRNNETNEELISNYERKIEWLKKLTA